MNIEKIFNSSKTLKSRIIYIICGVTLLIGCLIYFSNPAKSYSLPDNILNDRGNVQDQMIYLSDIEYSKASVGWGTLTFDKTQDNAGLTLKLDGYSTVFKKGIWAHATSTIEYDISEYQDYAYFTTYYGLNTTANNTGNGVKFYIYTSVDGNEWTLRTEENPEALKGVSNAKFAKIDIRGANYIRLYAYDNGSNASDHAVWADSKLIKENYTDDITIPLSEFDNYIKANYTSGAVNENLQLPLLQRTFISRIGQYTLRSFVDASPENYEMLRWFINNEEALRLWLVGGTPNGTYERALQVLSNLYHAHKEDLSNENLTPLGNKYKDLYLKMMLALSLTHSSNIGLWIGGNQFSDAVTRYEIYKDMHLNNQLLSNTMFENYTVEEMRWVMHVNIDDEEIKWLRDYSYKRFPDASQRFSPYSYVRYTTGYSYHRPQYYSAENYAKWDAKYNLSNYNITYQYGKPKLWIVFEEGAVCGGISKTAANLYGVWGVPASVVGQPGHAAYIYYYDVGGKGAWQLSYNVAATGWANTSGYTRMPNDWGNLNSGVVTNGANIKSASYFFLAQEAQNEYDKYEKAKLITLLANIYKDDRAKLERIYRDTLDVEIINWDAWLGLVNLYITDPTKTEEDLINLAEEIASALTYHPLPMYDLTRRIGTKITSSEYKGRLMIIQNRTLKKAKTATGANTLQYKEVPVVASALLGEINSEIATFSFSGTNANKIVLSTQLQSTQVNWEYSLDGGNTWKDVHESSVTLSAEEVASITDKNDIKVHINGLPLNEANIYTIDITKRSFPSGIIVINDEEDRLLNATRDMEWSLNPSEGWNSFATTNPLFSGNVRVYVRVIAVGTQLASDPVYYTFTENNTDDEAWYIQSKNLSVVEVNASGAGSWNNILDGNINTYFRTKENLMPAYVVIKLDQPRYISGLDYVPDKNAREFGAIPYGRARNVNIYVSMDKENWELAASKVNIGDNDNLKHFDFEPKKGLYVKFESTSVYEGPHKLLGISVIKLYENILVSDTPRADINYSIVGPTNKDVTAELVNLIRPITVTNNGGKLSHTFTENGEFTFEFEDADGNKGTATATVNWIDKTAPTVDVSFSTTEFTNEEVVATLTFSKDNITILNKDIQVAENPDKSKTITFDENDTVELEFMDSLGNIGKKTITVNWIDKTPPTAEITYSTLHLTDEPVTVELNPSEPITVTNNGGSTSYTFNENGEFVFEFIDRAGNRGTAKAIVSWIAKMPQYELKYSTTNPTKDDVEVTLTLEEGYRVVNNDANNKYTFTDNGTFGFQYIDKNGIVGEIKATVTWIDKIAPTAELKYDKTKDKVTVTVINPSEEITFKEGNGVYEFTENGSYEIIFYDKVGNIGSLTAVIDSIGKEEQPEEPDKPDIPDVPEEPDNPDIPDNPDEPDQPENPDKPENPGTTEPDNPDKPNEGSNETPDIPNKPVTPNEPNNPNKPTDKPNNDNNEDGKYQIYTIDNIDVKIPSNVIKEKGTLYINSFEVIEDIRHKFGSESEYYDIYLTNDKSERVDLYSAEPIKINIKINPNKEFIGIYEITNDNTIKPVDYVKDGDSIELSTKKLGKFVVSYKEENKLSPSKSTEKNKKQGILWTMIITVIVLFGLSIYVFKKKNNR